MPALRRGQPTVHVARRCIRRLLRHAPVMFKARVLGLDGEQQRIRNGGSAIYNPSIALVKIKLEEFKDTAIFQQNLKRNTTRTYNAMQDLRKQTNDFISQLWNEVEEGITADLPKHKRQIAQDYGLVYIFRRKEKKKLTDKDLQRDLLFDFA